MKKKRISSCTVAYIYMLFAGFRSVRMVKNCDQVLKNAAQGRRSRAAFSSPRSQFFTIRTDLKPANNMFIFFPAVNWLYRLQMGLSTQLLSFNGLARRLPTICKKSWQRTSNSYSRQKKDVLKNRLFSNYFMLAVFISLIKVSKIAFAVWNFVRSLKFYYKNNFCPSLSTSFPGSLIFPKRDPGFGLVTCLCIQMKYP